MGPRVEPISIAVVGTVGSSMRSFHGPLLRVFSDPKDMVLAFDVHYHEQGEVSVRALNAAPASYVLDRTGFHTLRHLRRTLSSGHYF